MTQNRSKQATQAALEAIPSIPSDADQPVFQAPWEAEAFAMVLALHQAGLFSWTEWAKTLSNSIDQAQSLGDPDLGDTYYLHWLNALEALVTAKGLGEPLVLKALADAWREAAASTPHGQPIELEPNTLAHLIK